MAKDVEGRTFSCEYFDCKVQDKGNCSSNIGCIGVACKRYKNCKHCLNAKEKSRFVCEYGRNW